ncbi:hypothetical protein ES702_06782 [subsurface metagenome]
MTPFKLKGKKTRRGRRIKIRKFVQQCIEQDIFSPTDMAYEYNNLYGLKGDKAKHRTAFTKAMRRLGISAKDRIHLKRESVKEEDVTDIMEYSEVQRYLGGADMQQISNKQKKRTVDNLRILWDWMGRTNPRLWEYSADAPDELNLVKCFKKHVGQDDKGRWNRPNQLLAKLGAFNRCFQGKLPKSWSMGLKRPAGELKDHWEIHEYDEFESKLEDTFDMSREGWIACYSSQITNGAREGATHEGESGILGLRWENIDFESRRCELRDKGTRGHPLVLWTQVPLDLFPWLNSWEKLMKYWRQIGEPKSGRCFPVYYNAYRLNFHKIRRRCETRISEDNEKQRPHIFRKTHAQWCKRIGVSLDNLCGDTKTTPHVGRYGVGWKDPKVPREYYLTKEPWEYEEQDLAIKTRLSKPLRELGFKSPLNGDINTFGDLSLPAPIVLSKENHK